MNVIDTFQDLVGQVNELLQPFIIAAAGAIPFVEGEGAAAIGVIGGMNVFVAAIAGMIGNFLCVFALVMLSSRARTAVVTRSRARAEARVGGGGVAVVTGGETNEQGVGIGVAPEVSNPARRAKFQRAFERYGVPGVSLLGPLLLPTQFTATMLAASGVGRARILLWQGLAILLWTSVVTLLFTGVLTAVG